MTHRLLHIGTERAWRGGENQVRLLVTGGGDEFHHHVAYPERTPGWERLSALVPGVALSSSSPFDPRSIARVAAYCRREGIALLDAHSASALSLALFVKRILPSIRLVYHRRVDNPIKTTWPTRRKVLSPRVDRIVAISDAIARLLADYGVPAAKIRTVRSAVDPGPYTPLRRAECRARWCARAGIPSAALVIGFAGALAVQKGPDLLLLAFAELARTHPAAHLVMAGTGKLEAALRARRAELGLAPRVSLVGFVEDIPDLLQAFDVFALPSRWEGLGTVGLEALLAETPVVAARVGGIPEFIRDGETGLLFPAGDVAAIARALARLAREPAFRGALAQAGKAVVLRDFSLDSMLAGNRAVYRGLLP